jgi:hypothetical protein
MDKAEFVAKTDLQIGDKVQISYGVFYETNFEIYDIKTIHKLRNNTVHFEFQLTKNGDLTDWLPRNKLSRIE